MIRDTNQASSVPVIFIFFLWKHAMGRWADGCSQRIKGESGSLRADMKHLGNRCHLRDTQSKEVRMQRLALSRLWSASSLSGYTLTAQSVRFLMYKQAARCRTANLGSVCHVWDKTPSSVMRAVINWLKLGDGTWVSESFKSFHFVRIEVHPSSLPPARL